MSKIAHVYADRFGWAVIPLHNVRPDGSCSCEPRADGKPCTDSRGKHPRLSKWQDSGTTDAEQIASWWHKYPAANVGIVTGSASGIWVLDVDPKNGGDHTLAELVNEHGPLPRTPRARTGSGGEHYVFRMPGYPVSNAKVGQGLDVRGDGGQIVAAPSRSGVGGYSWIEPPWKTPPAEAPAWLLARLGRGAGMSSSAPAPARGNFPPATPAVLDEARAALKKHGPAVDGDAGGLHTVQAAAILTHDFALTDEEAWPLLVEWNETCQPPWELEGSNSLRTMLGRGRKYGKAAYGCRRSLDALETVRMRIADWRELDARLSDDGERNRALEALVQDARGIVGKCGDPLRRDRIQTELMAATGLRALALALPRVVVRDERPREPSAEQATWTAYRFELGSNNAPLCNLDNAVRVLEHEREQRGLFFDSFAIRVCKGDGTEWTDEDSLSLTLDMQRRLGLVKMTTETVNQAVRAHALAHARDRVGEYLAGLRWDGVERIASFFVNAYGAEDSAYTRAASANFWKSLVARALRPGCKADCMVVLEGAQGIRKSSSLRVIVGDTLFAEASEKPTSKDFYLALQGKLLVEVAEMDSFSRSDVTAVKRVLSCQSDRFRVPFGKTSQDFPRRGVFVGTTNRSDWARDETGNRRFWPITCSRVDLDFIRDNRDQLLAEAVHEFNQGAAWWEMPAEATEKEQEARRLEHPWEDLISDYLHRSGNPEVVTVVDVLSMGIRLDPSRMDRAAQMQAASTLKRLGFVKEDGWHKGRKAKLWRRKVETEGSA
ncbi:VapE domain-containing protein [Cystobacter fuscus]|uniref:VapE domain-containing protein n=1 Tax=Cystobacter fuscus TaxID=43 RepID=UPI0037C18852